ncbi:hypothetical protein P691DRAFT_773868 [Macrolepiota fuliginosa MF-IS2]|uniref:Integral membrane protein n=1 Tax=Macrolepiota fuliginosa MF-IS2 TaxID=1400762 RepID=A0A9P5XJW1_9AGAR|nr:hypothetical protein P691DRAFT_773868 [Macrolepiota fuliginosa MF-IS2]
MAALLTILFYILHALAIPTCVARLFYRRRTHRLWWDDFWAFVALLWDCAMIIVISLRKVQVDAKKSNFIRFATYVTAASTLWGARLCIAVTIVRLVPPGRGSLTAKGVSVLFAVIWVVLIVQKFFICGYPSLNITTCKLPKTTGILELCTSLGADIWLICSPAYLLWDSKLSHRRQVLIFSVFASNILLTGASIAHGVSIIKQSNTWVGFTSQVELAVSLMTCNLLVLVTWIYSRIYPADDRDNSSTSDYTTRTTRPPNRPVYGFEGSALILTEISTPIMTTSGNGTFDNPSSKLKSTPGSDQSRPRSRSLDDLRVVRPPESSTQPFHLHRVQTCPAIVNLYTLTTRKKPNNQYIDLKRRYRDLGFITEWITDFTGEEDDSANDA